MDILKGKLVKKWVEAVDRLCDSDPTYDWNDACRAVAHRLEREKTVTSEKIRDAAREYWGDDDTRGYSITVGDLEQVKDRIHADPPRRDAPRDIALVPRFRLKK
jgi:hypothetical protein